MFRRVAVSVALPAVLASMLACGAAPVDSEQAEASVEQPIYNGTPIAAANTGHLAVWVPIGGGYFEPSSAELISNGWALTDKHIWEHYDGHSLINVYAGTTIVGSVKRHVDHPTIDASMIEFNAPVTMNGAPDGYYRPFWSWPVSQLLTKPIRCYGYGHNQYNPTTKLGSGGYSTLRYGDAKINSADSTYYYYTSASSQLPLPGDSGGGCYLNTPIGEVLTGLIEGGYEATKDGLDMPVSTFDRWIVQTMKPNRSLWCHGLLCVTTADLLPNGLSAATFWLPCKGRPWSWQLDYSMEWNYDFVDIDRKPYTGAGSISGNKPAGSSLEIEMYTDGSVASRGVARLMAKCL